MNRSVFGPISLAQAMTLPLPGEKLSVYGIEVDNFYSKRIEGAEEVSFVARLESDGEMDYNVMDSVIQYCKAKVNVFMEVDADLDFPADSMLIMANSMGCGLIIRNSKGDEGFDAWAKAVLSYTKGLLKNDNFSQELLPVTSYIQYLAMEHVGHKPSGITDDTMMFRYFEEGVDVARMDALKDEMRAVIYDHYGGKEGFDVIINSTVVALQEAVDDVKAVRVEQMLNFLNSEEFEQFQSALGNFLNQSGVAEESHDSFFSQMKALREAGKVTINHVEELINQLRA